MGRNLLRCLCGVAACLAVIAMPAAAPARQDQPVAAGAAGEIALDVDRFGVGDVVRPGDWAGVRVRVTDSAAKQRTVVIQLVVPDADSDRVLLQREITTNPGVPQGTWVYLRLPSQFAQGKAFDAYAYEAIENAGEQIRPGRLLGTGRLVSKAVVEPTTGLMAVIGPKDFGLKRYSVRSNGATYLPFGHEVTEVVSGLAPTELPDRWMGLAPYEVIVWGQGNPSELRAERAAALKEWVRRGGHLVIVLPAVGEGWTNPQASELHELMPAVSVARREGVDLNAYRGLVTWDAKVSLPRDAVVYQFKPVEGAPPSDAMRILSGPQGECVVARRLYGAGTVTLVGIDLNHRVLADFEALEPSVFWNRVLGRRGMLPSGRQMNEDLKNSVPQRGGEIEFDNEIAGLISQPGDAATGILLGLVVFVGYWLIAGPVGYMVLKRRGWIRHSWLAFVVAGAVFTGVAWGGAFLMRPRRVAAEHVTIMDHVFGQPVDRARAWLSVLVPTYGTATVAVGESSGERPEFTNLIAAWDPPNLTGPVGSFPDARGYVVDARSPTRITFPVRSTVKQLQVDWAGGPVWKMPFPVVGPDGTPEKLTASERAGVGESWAQGKLTHELPVALKDVWIIVVPRQYPLTTGGLSYSRMYSNATAFRPAEWEPGAVLDLGAVTAIKSNTDMVTAQKAFQDLRSRLTPADAYQKGFGGNAPATRPTDAVDRLVGGAFFSQLEPPDANESIGFGRPGAPIARRRLTHTWDLSRWFSQPCIMIVGRLGDAKGPCPCPIPLTVNGEKLPTTGTTILRWIYPLPDNPPLLKRPDAETESEFPATGQPGPT